MQTTIHNNDIEINNRKHIIQTRTKTLLKELKEQKEKL